MNTNRSFHKQNKRDVLNRTPSVSPGKTSGKKTMGIRIYNFSNLQSYGQIGASLSKSKQKTIMQKLQLEKDTAIRTEQRMKTGQTFVPYKYNPMSLHKKRPQDQFLEDQGKKAKKHQVSTDKQIKFNKSHNKSQSQQALQSTQDRGHLIEQMYKLRYKRFQASMLISQTKQQRQLLSKLSQMIMEKDKKEEIKQRQISQIQKEKNSVKYDQNIMSFDDIVAIEEQSFFTNQLKDINIFEVLYKDRQSFDPTEELKKHFFSYQNTIEKIGKIKIHFDRDLSKKARDDITKKPRSGEQCFQNTDNFVFSELKFEDLMNVASGRSTPEFVYLRLNRQRGIENDSSSEHENNAINYRPGSFNKGHMVQKQHQNSKHLLNMIKKQPNKKEIKYEKQSQNKKQVILQKLKNEINLIQTTILDKKIHKDIKNSVNKDLSDFLQQKQISITQPKSTMQKIQRKKKYTDRKQSITVDKLSETCIMVKEQVKKMHKYLQQRGK